MIRSGAFAAVLMWIAIMALVVRWAMASFPVLDRRALPSLPGIVVANDLQIARSKEPAGGLWLACSGRSELRIVLYTRLPIDADVTRNGTVGGIQAELLVLAEDVRTIDYIRSAPLMRFADTTWSRDAQNDVLLTSPLSVGQLAVLARAFLPKAPAVVRIDAVETGTELRGSVRGDAMSEFASSCVRN